MPLILPGNVASATASTTYGVDNSCRFDSASQDQLSRDTVSATDAEKFTLSVWLKRSELASSAGACRFYQGYLDDDNRLYMQFDTSDKLFIYGATGGTAEIYWQSSRVFRDTAAWYHLVFQADSTDGTQADRMKVYVNGVAETSWSKTNSPNQNINWGNQLAQTNGNLNISGENRDPPHEIFDGYMAEVCFIDGLALAPTEFGEYDSDSPTIWKPKDVSGLTFGNNGFYLDFKDSANLGNDANGGTDFTEDNLTSIDQATDTPTNNFATANPLIRNDYIQYSEGNLNIYYTNSTYWRSTISTIGASLGKWFAEFNVSAVGGEVSVGICDVSTLTQTSSDNYMGQVTDNVGYVVSGNIYKEASIEQGSLATYTTDDIIGVAMDLDNNTVQFYKNGSTIGTTTSLTANKTYAFGVSGVNNARVLWNLGSPSYTISSGNADGNGYGNFEYSVPANHYSLCTKNLAEFG